MLRSSNETKQDRNNLMQSLESMMLQSEARIRNEVMAVERSLNNLSRVSQEMKEQLRGTIVELNHQDGSLLRP